jgi:hypothetical protein
VIEENNKGLRSRLLASEPIIESETSSVRSRSTSHTTAASLWIMMKQTTLAEFTRRRYVPGNIVLLCRKQFKE